MPMYAAEISRRGTRRFSDSGVTEVMTPGSPGFLPGQIGQLGNTCWWRAAFFDTWNTSFLKWNCTVTAVSLWAVWLIFFCCSNATCQGWICGFLYKQVQLPIALTEADSTFNEVREGSRFKQNPFNIYKYYVTVTSLFMLYSVEKLKDIICKYKYMWKLGRNILLDCLMMSPVNHWLTDVTFSFLSESAECLYDIWLFCTINIKVFQSWL